MIKGLFSVDQTSELLRESLLIGEIIRLFGGDTSRGSGEFYSCGRNRRFTGARAVELKASLYE